MTEATMMTRERPALLDVLRAQFVLLLRSTRPVLLLVVAAVFWAVVTYGSVVSDPFEGAAMARESWLVLMYVLGAIWGVQIWHDEGPARRVGHWRMPVDTAVHDMVRVAAGAVWLCLGVTAFLLYGALFLAVIGELGAALGMTPLIWLGYYTAALIGYLLMATFTTLFNRGFEWSLLFGMAALVAWVELVEWGQGHPRWLDPLARVLDAAIGGAYGFSRAVTGIGGIATTGGPLPVPVIQEQPDGSVLRDLTEVWTQADWAVAAGLWILIGILAVAAAAHWHRWRRQASV